MKQILLFGFILSLLFVSLYGCSKRSISPAKISKAQTQRLFSENCATCHGARGQGTGVGVSLASTKKMPVSDIESVIRDGRGNMPGWKDRLSDTEIHALAEYVRTLHY